MEHGTASGADVGDIASDARTPWVADGMPGDHGAVSSADVDIATRADDMHQTSEL